MIVLESLFHREILMIHYVFYPIEVRTGYPLSAGFQN